MHVLIFGSVASYLGTAGIAKALSKFVIVKEVHWQYRTLLKRTQCNPLKVSFRALEFIYWVLRLLKEISKFQADIIVTEFAYSTGFIGAIAAKLSRKPCIIRAGGSDLKIGTQTRLGKTMVSWSLKNVSGVMCVSRDLQNIAIGLGAKNSIFIPPPIDFSDLREKKIDKKNKVIISVAFLTPIKGISYLIGAMKYIQDCKLVIIGDGPERKKLESLALTLELSDRIFFMGWINHSTRFWDCLQMSTVFVLPSLSEGTPRALIEAMACGLPVVATNVGGIPEIVRNGLNGYVVPSRNEEALAEAIELVLNDVQFQNTASCINKEIAKDYSLSTIGPKIYTYLKEYVIKDHTRK